MRVLAIANQKGGTGKTTTAIHLATALASQGKRVLLIDLDPQAHATMGLGFSPRLVPGMARVFRSEARLSEIVSVTRAGFHLAPSSLEVAEYEGMAERILNPERRVARALEEIDGRYDWVLIDCPPRADGILCVNAVRAASAALLVVEMGAFALQGALAAQRIFTELAADPLARIPASRSDAPAQPLELRIVATRYQRASRFDRDLLVAMHAQFGPILCETVIQECLRLREAGALGAPVQHIDPGSTAVADFDALAHELLEWSRARVTPEPALAPVSRS